MAMASSCQACAPTQPRLSGIGSCKSRFANGGCKRSVLFNKQKTLGSHGFRKFHFSCNALVEQKEKLRICECLDKMREAIGVEELSDFEQVNVTGKQVFLGMEGEWKFSWCTDGRFYEKFSNEEVIVDGGYEGKGKPWHADYAGRVTRSDLDDFETCLLVSWLRTGFWLLPDGQKRVIAVVSTDPSLCSDEQIIKLNIRDLKVVANVHVNTNTWLITKMSMDVFGGEDRWEYSDWRFVIPGSNFRFPCSIKRHPPAGGTDTFFLELAEVGQLSPSLFALPSSFMIPRGNPSCPSIEFDESIAPSIRMIHTLSGHYVVKPLIDGQEIGYFVVDTGASGLSIAPFWARNLSMTAFGEIYVSGVENQAKSQFVRGKTFELGRLKILNPLFIEVNMEGVVKGVSPVAGICGFDLFYSCIVEMSMADRTLSLFSPSNYGFLPWRKWETMYMLENVPHVPVKFNGHETLFLLDTGAGGVDAIFPSKTVEKYNLLKESSSLLDAKVRGVNASSGVQALFGEVESFEVGGFSFEKIRALFFKGEGAAMKFSVYTGGILCEQLLRSLLLVMDYQRCRICFVNPVEE